MLIDKTISKNVSIQQFRVPTELYIEIAKRLNDRENIRDGMLRMLRENISGERHIVVIHDAPVPVVVKNPRGAPPGRPNIDREASMMDAIVHPILAGRASLTVEQIGGEVMKLFAPGANPTSVIARVARSLRRAGWSKYRMPADERGRRGWAYKPLWPAEK